jgi:hypothetical protein
VEAKGSTTAGSAEPCLRCGAAMDWRHQTWQCPRCLFKIGCCEGDAPADCAKP